MADATEQPRERVRDLTRRLVAAHDPATTPAEELWGAQFDAGLAWIHFPEGRGGLGLPPDLQMVVDEELRAAGAPSNVLRNFMGVGMAGPTLVAHGTPEQQERLLRPLFTCEEIWCQLFSEPGAGSDLASLSTRAEQDGDTWVVTGQKVWCSNGRVADKGILLARTDPDAPKHKGISFFLVDMRAPGVETRPLRQLTGDSEFDEVFLDEVRIPDNDLVGPLHGGWGVAMSTLTNERGHIGA
ncbi:MAG TPA: acyl-CoA dehydrogenase family protein, partial [Egibacteraceae bacterium]|nr:acyl-CoA dehydrogenase family protein [Egibacteraceae bacterium]